MILKLFMQRKKFNQPDLDYHFEDNKTGKLFARATNYYNEYIKLYYNENTYEFNGRPKMLPKRSFKCPYPLNGKGKKMPGFEVLSNDKQVMCFYGEAVTCRKKWIFKTNIGLKVYALGKKTYCCYRVGFSDDNSHYYCILDEDMKTIGMIERHSYSEDGSRATIYVEDDENILIALLVCTEQVIWVANTGDDGERMDSSAGHYISILPEEQEFFDGDFLTRVKEK